MEEQIKKHYPEVYDGAMDFMDSLNQLKKQTMKITEETKIKDLIPEGYELEKIDFCNKSLENISILVHNLHIPIKKKEVKDFKWYCENYFNEITPSYNENDDKSMSNSKYDKCSFESKIGLLKFICDDIGVDWKHGMKMQLNGWSTIAYKTESICPPEFINSIFDLNDGI